MIFCDTARPILLGALLRGLRVERARKLLESADIGSITMVATASGFASERQFYRVFGRRRA
ncbi:hypothetical protein ACFVAV_19955 [Nocardia sp. NPDC057663]|uniref:hypothetical protein n=1 Tax=Nocardia sp. NPDC057663 TaxID=3346201 RepID=UPI003670FAF0